MPVSYSAEASHDLDDIFLYIAVDSSASAERTLLRLIEACESLAELPSRGRRSADGQFRELVAAPYVISYAVDGSDVAIARIRHHAQRR